MVKQKLKQSDKFVANPTFVFGLVLTTLTLLTFILSLLPSLPAPLIERWYSRGAFPKISEVFGFIADSVPFAWLDVLIVLSILYIWICIHRRRWMPIFGAVAFGYLIFFWSWGLNYHRLPLPAKLSVDVKATSADAMDAFSHRIGRELNTLYTEAGQSSYDENKIREEAVARVARVVETLDGTHWRAAYRIKVSIFANPWFRAAGIDGLFNPIVHEPIINSSVLDIERPFVIAHELAHVRGYPDEGDANFVAVLATLLSEDAKLQYSGWLQLWFYVRTPELEASLDAGPKGDIRRILDRLRGENVAWISSFQYALLDWYLKANNVPQGVRSYSGVVLLAAETQKIWDQFR